MLTTSQCQKPLPVGASGSYMVSARLFASAGTSFHTSGGEVFSPVQPKAFAVCFRGIVPLAPIAGLEISKADAGEESTTTVRAARRPPPFICLTPLGYNRGKQPSFVVLKVLAIEVDAYAAGTRILTAHL